MHKIYAFLPVYSANSSFRCPNLFLSISEAGLSKALVKRLAAFRRWNVAEMELIASTSSGTQQWIVWICLLTGVLACGARRLGEPCCLRMYLSDMSPHSPGAATVFLTRPLLHTENYTGTPLPWWREPQCPFSLDSHVTAAFFSPTHPDVLLLQSGEDAESGTSQTGAGSVFPLTVLLLS